MQDFLGKVKRNHRTLLKHGEAWTTHSGARRVGKALQGDPHVLLMKRVGNRGISKCRVSSIFSGYKMVCDYNLIQLKFSERLESFSISKGYFCVMKSILTAEETEDMNGKICVKAKTGTIPSAFIPSKRKSFKKGSRISKLSQHLRSHMNSSRELRSIAKAFDQQRNLCSIKGLLPKVKLSQTRKRH